MPVKFFRLICFFVILIIIVAVDFLILFQGPVDYSFEENFACWHVKNTRYLCYGKKEDCIYNQNIEVERLKCDSEEESISTRAKIQSGNFIEFEEDS